MTCKAPEIISTWSVLDTSADTRTTPSISPLTVSNAGAATGEVVLDYGRCEGGIPIFVVDHAFPSEGEHDVPFRVVYSETREGIDLETGKSPSNHTLCAKLYSDL